MSDSPATDPQRTSEFQRHSPLERALGELNSLLEPAQKIVTRRHEQPKFPTVFVMGAPRCGSTLTLQWIAQTGCFGYPSNMLSRFFNAPYIGALIQQIFTEYDVREEILGPSRRFEFESNLGKTHGPMAPNEFWYFWRRFFDFGEIQKLDESEVNREKVLAFAAELAALESALHKPVAMKGMVLNWDIPLLDNALDRVLFLYVHREEFFNAQSILFAREKFYGERTAWYSFKPPEYYMLKDLGPTEQAAGQVYFTNQAIERGLAEVDASRKLRIEYEQFCRAPHEVFELLKQKLSQGGVDVAEWDYRGPESFPVSQQETLPAADVTSIRNALTRFHHEEMARC